LGGNQIEGNDSGAPIFFMGRKISNACDVIGLSNDKHIETIVDPHPFTNEGAIHVELRTEYGSMGRFKRGIGGGQPSRHHCGFTEAFKIRLLPEDWR
jgi:hypothetical protein